MRVEELDYTLRPENIAREPREIRHGRRDLSRLLVVDRRTGRCRHSEVLRLPDWLEPGDVFVLNDSKRLPGVLVGRTSPKDGQVELRFAELLTDSEATCRIFPMHHIRVGTLIRPRRDPENVLRVVATGVTAHGLARVRCEGPIPTVAEILRRSGLPITSFFYRGYWSLEHYNNHYAASEGSFESPMAGLHLTPELLDRMRARGVHLAFVTLHVVGSWLPFLEVDVESHTVQPEHFVVPEATANLILQAKSAGHRVVACGSTSMRALESAARGAAGDTDPIRSGPGTSNLYIRPGYRFRVVDGYFTNFHPARSSLMVLDAAFCGKRHLLDAYKVASDEGYLFHEFGDAVFYV